jgi:putative redox protein
MIQAHVQFGKGKINQEIQIGTHSLLSDELLELGGDNSGPSPHDYLAAALGACTGMTLRMYAAHKKWPLDDVDLTVTLFKDETGAHFLRELKLVGALDETQRQRLLEIANKCPVHLTLSGKIEIKTTLI